MNALLSGGDDALETLGRREILARKCRLKERTAAMLERSGRNSNAARIREDAKAQMEQAELLRERIVEVQKRPQREYATKAGAFVRDYSDVRLIVDTESPDGKSNVGLG